MSRWATSPCCFPASVYGLVYGLVGADLFLVLPNALAIVTGSLLIAVAFALRRAESGSPDDLTVADPTSR